MDKILFASRLKEQIEIKYKTQTAFAIEYDRKFNPGTFCNEANSPHKGTLSTIKKYVSSTAPTIPSLDKIDNMCQLLDCDIDYLLGKINEPKHVYQAMRDQCGLSNDATEQLMYWNTHGGKYTETLNHILVSANFDHVLYHSVELMKAKPIFIGLSETYHKWQTETYSQPMPPEGYPSGTGLREMYDRAETKYDIEKLRLNEYLTYLVSELESISMKKHTGKGD